MLGTNAMIPIRHEAVKIISFYPSTSRQKKEETSLCILSMFHSSKLHTRDLFFWSYNLDILTDWYIQVFNTWSLSTYRMGIRHCLTAWQN